VVWLLWYSASSDDGTGDGPILIGAYSSAQAAQEATRRLSSLPGFREHPEITIDAGDVGFYAEEYRVGEDHWTAGFQDPSE
jgi:hypothetical protein